MDSVKFSMTLKPNLLIRCVIVITNMSNTMNFRQARPKVHNEKPFEEESFDSIATKFR